MSFIDHLLHPVSFDAKKLRRSIGQKLLHVGCFGMGTHAVGLAGLLPLHHDVLNLLGATGATLAGIAAYFLE